MKPILLLLLSLLPINAADLPRHYWLKPRTDEVIGNTPEVQPEKGKNKAVVRASWGKPEYRIAGGEWTTARVGFSFLEGATFRTRENEQIDFFLGENGPIIRMLANSTLSFLRLRLENTGLEKVIETQLHLPRGRILGNVKKMAKASVYEIKTPVGVARIRGTEYNISAEGEVHTVTGTVLFWDRAGKRSVNVQAGQSIFPRASGNSARRSLFDLEK